MGPDFRWLRADGQWHVRVNYPGGPYFILTHHQAAELAATLAPWLLANPPARTDDDQDGH